jgi:hypothetical protein
MQSKGPPSSPPVRKWQALDDTPRPTRPTEQWGRGLRGFFRKLAQLASIDGYR